MVGISYNWTPSWILKLLLWDYEQLDKLNVWLSWTHILDFPYNYLFAIGFEVWYSQFKAAQIIKFSKVS